MEHKQIKKYTIQYFRLVTSKETLWETGENQNN